MVYSIFKCYDTKILPLRTLKRETLLCKMFYLTMKEEITKNIAKQKQSCPATGLNRPWGSGRLRPRIFLTFGTVKVVRSSALRTGRLYSQELSWYSFLEAESTPGHMVPSVASEKIPSDTTGDRSRDLPTSNAVP